MQKIVNTAPTAGEGDRVHRMLSAMVGAGINGSHLHAVFERWDGGGFPAGRAGAQIPVATRFGQLSYDAPLLHEHFGGIGRIARLAGGCYDPDVVVLLRADDAAEVTARALLGGPAPVEGSTGHTQLRVALLFRGLADALDGIAYCRTELPQQRCRGALHLPHGVVNPRV